MAVYIEAPDESQPRTDEEPEAEAAGLPPLEAGQQLDLVRLEPKQHFTQPPRGTPRPRSSRNSRRRASAALDLRSDPDDDPEARLRPEGRTSLQLTDLGETVTDLLVEAFPDVLEVAFTAQMEESLDEIEEGGRKWVETVREFYDRFAKDLKRAGREMDDLKKGKRTDESCPLCGEGQLLERGGGSAGSWPASGIPTASTRGTSATRWRPSLNRREWIARPVAGRWSSRTGGSAASSPARGIRVQDDPADHPRDPVSQDGVEASSPSGGRSAGDPTSGAPATRLQVRGLAAPGREPVPQVRAPFLVQRGARGSGSSPAGGSCGYTREAESA